MNYLHSQRRLLRKGVSSLIAIFCALLLVMPALAATETKMTIPFSGTIDNPCNGELVAFSGEAHLTTRVTLDNGGGFHLGSHTDIRVTGFGDLGNRYVGSQGNNSDTNGKVGGEQTQLITVKLISKGSAPNAILHSLFHITVNANGDVTAFVDNSMAEPECRG